MASSKIFRSIVLFQWIDVALFLWFQIWIRYCFLSVWKSRKLPSLVRNRSNIAIGQITSLPLTHINILVQFRVCHLLYPAEGLPKSVYPSARLPVDRYVTHGLDRWTSVLKIWHSEIFTRNCPSALVLIKIKKVWRTLYVMKRVRVCNHFQADITLPFFLLKKKTKQKLCTDFRLHWREVCLE